MTTRLLSYVMSCVVLPYCLQAQAATFSIPAQTIEQGAQNVEVPLHLETSQPIYAFSFAIEVTRSQLRLDRIELSGTAASGAAWSFGQQLGGRGRLYWGMILDDSDPITGAIAVGNDILLAKIVVDSRPEAAGPTTIRLKDFDPNLSENPVDPGGQNIVVGAAGNVLSLGTQDGEITTVVPVLEVGPFKRGDCNQDGENITLSDAIFYLNAVFSTGRKPDCRAACDFNGDGLVEASTADAAFYLGFVFLGGPPIPAPRDSCQISTRDSDLTVGCEDPVGCP